MFLCENRDTVCSHTTVSQIPVSGFVGQDNNLIQLDLSLQLDDGHVSVHRCKPHLILLHSLYMKKFSLVASSGNVMLKYPERIGSSTPLVFLIINIGTYRFFWYTVQYIPVQGKRFLCWIVERIFNIMWFLFIWNWYSVQQSFLSKSGLMELFLDWGLHRIFKDDFLSINKRVKPEAFSISNINSFQIRFFKWMLERKICFLGLYECSGNH